MGLTKKDTEHAITQAIDLLELARKRLRASKSERDLDIVYRLCHEAETELHPLSHEYCDRLTRSLTAREEVAQ